MTPNRSASSSSTDSSRPIAPGAPRRAVLASLAALLVLPGCAGVAPRSPAEPDLLRRTWEGYRRRFVRPDGRVVRPMDGSDTVSEGQAYAMLRAAWMDDRTTFDAAYGWAEAHLSRTETRGDHLLAWRWGRYPAGGWGVLDWRAASDADEDYGLALLFAAARWGRPAAAVPDYRAKAHAVLADLVRLATQEGPDGRLYFMPGDWRLDRLILNPSYFAPAWYRVFGEATGDPRWGRLVESSYAAVQALAERLGPWSGVGLMPDWAALQPDGSFAPAPGFSAVHGWDAFRTPWRLFLDWLWFNEPRARAYLAERLFPFLQAEWDRNGGRLYAEYRYDGTPIRREESAATYAAYLAAFLAAGSPLADALLGKLRGAVREDPAGAYFDLPDDYYLNNWGWFGLLLGEGRGINLWR